MMIGVTNRLVEAVQQWVKREAGYLTLTDEFVRGLIEVALREQPAPEPVAWMRVIDEAMVTHYLGVADPADDYETAKRKMNNLLCMAQDIGTYFAKQAEPVQEPVAWVECDGDLVWNNREAAIGRNLYAAPPQRKPLTDEEIHECFQQRSRDKVVQRRLITRAIERAHGIGGEE